MTKGLRIILILKLKKIRLMIKNIHKVLTLVISTVWLVNGLFCKVLNLATRHEQIISRVLGQDYSRPLTILVGLSEIVMAIWVFTKFKSKLNAITQIIVVVTMNIIEFTLVPDLLLWGRLNIVFAFMFVGLVYYNEFVLNKNLNLRIKV
jgi:hypothetical protein